MPGIHIVTDSSCDLVESDLGELDVEIVPLSIRFGAEEFTDGLDLTVAEFYGRMAEAEELPQTACPSPGAFEKAFTRATEAGADAVVCVNISGDLSNTLQSARTASEAMGGRIPVHVIDSRSVSSGLGTLVLEAARAARETTDVDAVVRRVRSLIPRTYVFAALNTLENLKKGGRIGGAMAMLGSVLAQGHAHALREDAPGGIDRARGGDARRCARHRRVPRPHRTALPPGVGPTRTAGGRHRGPRGGGDHRGQLGRPRLTPGGHTRHPATPPPRHPPATGE